MTTTSVEQDTPGVEAPSIPAAVYDLRALGLRVCRTVAGEKNPTYDDWPTFSLEAWDFTDGGQPGLMGGPLDYVDPALLPEGVNPGEIELVHVIIDLDDLDVLAVADDYLADTKMVEGRAGKPRSHRHYLVDATKIPAAHTCGYGGTAPLTAAYYEREDRLPGPRTRSFTRPNKKEAFRLIAAGGQAVCPPSLHPSGERREWEGGEIGKPVLVDYMDLWLACCDLAAATGCKVPKVDDDAIRDEQCLDAETTSRKTQDKPTDSTVGVVVVGALGGASVPPPSPDAADDTADQLIIDDIAASVHGDRWRRLLRGDLSDYNGDESAAHQALCNWFAARVGDDPARILRMLGRLAFVVGHAKWGRADYWDRTIRKAIDDTKARGQGARLARPSDHTDVANSRRLVRDYGEVMRYCGPQKEFYTYSPESGVWRKDDGRRVEHLAKLTTDKMLKAATRAVRLARRGGDPREIEAAEAQLKWALTTQKDTRRILNMARLASSEPELAVEPTDFDADRWLLNTPNGVIDLTTGRKLAHSPDYMMTRSAPTLYDPDARCPTWEGFIASVFNGDLELIRWMQRYLGYCLTGDVAIQILAVLYGTGRNGKSTLIDTLAEVVGPYWGKAAPDLMLSKHYETHPTEIANLSGLRLAFSVETDEGRKLNEGRVKELTGDATLTARRMREDFWTFDRTHKLVLITNNKPRVEVGGDGMWRRLRLVPFAQKYWLEDKGESGPEHLKADLRLPEKLLAESRGILAWLVRGAVECYRDDLRLGPCRAIAAATADYQSGEDTFQAFVGECLDVRPGDGEAELPSDDALNLYQRWAADNGAAPLKKRAMTEKLLALGVTRRESHGKTVYVGVRVR